MKKICLYDKAIDRIPCYARNKFDLELTASIKNLRPPISIFHCHTYFGWNPFRFNYPQDLFRYFDNILWVLGTKKSFYLWMF